MSPIKRNGVRQEPDERVRDLVLPQTLVGVSTSHSENTIRLQGDLIARATSTFEGSQSGS